MVNVMISVANAMSEETILEQMKDAINEYKLIPTESNREKIIFISHLFIIKDVTKGDKNKGKEMMNDVENIKKIMNAFKSTN